MNSSQQRCITDSTDTKVLWLSFLCRSSSVFRMVLYFTDGIRQDLWVRNWQNHSLHFSCFYPFSFARLFVKCLVFLDFFFLQAGRIQGQFWRPLTSKSPVLFQYILPPFPSPGPVPKVDCIRTCFTVVRAAGHESLLRNTYSKNHSDSPLVLPFRSIILIDHYVVG